MRAISRSLTRNLLLDLFLAILALAAGAGPALGEVVTFQASKDNTLCEPEPDMIAPVSNGGGEHIFAGSTANTDQRRRALIAFNVSDGSIAPGSQINSVKLTLHVSRVKSAEAKLASLHRVSADWGEQLSNAGGEEGRCANALPGDATWDERLLGSAGWATPGGDFAALSSATIGIGGVGFYTWDSTLALIADVQSWLDNPAANFGWTLIGDETTTLTAKRFDSRSNTTLVGTQAVTPVLEVDFTPPQADAFQVDASDGTFNDKVRVTWIQQPGAVSYRVFL